MEQTELIPRLFRTEYRKIVSVLCRRFGFDQIEIAEDIASDTFLTAAQTWGLNGVPPYPTAWLYTAAKNRATNFLHRNAIFTDTIAPELQSSPSGSDDNDIDLSPHNTNDSQLQMMFAICHPSISHEAQVGLSLRKDLCLEALRLCNMLVENEKTNTPEVNALLARCVFTLRDLTPGSIATASSFSTKNKIRTSGTQI
jgi:predicted RNA polymerase sigma factor